MYTVVHVTALNPDGSLVVGCDVKACENCRCSMFCSSKSLSEYSVLNPKDLDVRVGCKVEVFLPPARTVMSTFLLFGLPLALFALGYLCAVKLLSFSEFGGALVGFGAMAVAFLCSYAVTSRHRKALMPVVTKVVENSLM